MAIKEPTYTIRLFNDGCDTPVAIYRGVTEYHTREEGRVLIFTRANGSEDRTNMRWHATRGDD